MFLRSKNNCIIYTNAEDTINVINSLEKKYSLSLFKKQIRVFNFGSFVHMRYDQLHNHNGPLGFFTNGRIHYYLKGISRTKEEWELARKMYLE